MVYYLFIDSQLFIYFKLSFYMFKHMFYAVFISIMLATTIHYSGFFNINLGVLKVDILNINLKNVNNTPQLLNINKDKEWILTFNTTFNIEKVESIWFTLLYNNKELNIDSIINTNKLNNLEISEINSWLVKIKLIINKPDIKKNTKIIELHYSKLNNIITDIIPAEIYYKDTKWNKIFIESNPISF